MTNTTTPPAVSVTLAGRGFRGSYAKFRVAWSTDPTVDPASDARSRAFRLATEAGRAGVEYASGAEARDVAICAALAATDGR